MEDNRINIAAIEKQNHPDNFEPVCHCGEFVKDHELGDNHAPVEMPQQAQASTEEVLRMCEALRACHEAVTNAEDDGLVFQRAEALLEGFDFGGEASDA